MSLTTDPNDPRLGHGADTEPQDQHDVYLVLVNPGKGGLMNIDWIQFNP